MIFFQPVIASQSDQILHHEVLSKVRDNQGKLISARVFLPMAQKCGLNARVDLLVFEQVCRLLQYEKKQQEACSLFKCMSITPCVTPRIKASKDNTQLPSSCYLKSERSILLYF